MNALKKFPHIEFFYDVVSPYSYFGFVTLNRYQKAYNLNVTYRPFFLGGIMGLTGNRPPAELPARGAYMFKDLRRQQKYFDIPPITMPKSFPVNTITAQRVLTYLYSTNDPLQLQLSLKLWQLFWNNGANISNLDVLKEAMKECGASDDQVAHILLQAESDQVKENLKTATQEAKDRGAFGAPTIFVQQADVKEEMYFGSDRFHIIFPSIGIKWDGPHPLPHKL